MADARKSSQVVIQDRYEVLSGEPLPEFGAGTAQAYRVRDRRDARTSLFALVCDPRASVRFEDFAISADIESPYFMRMSDWAIADWPLTEAQCPILIFPRPEGGLLFPQGGGDIEPMHEDLAMEKLVKPLYHALRDCRNAGLMHRNIRPENIFLDASVGGNAILGQCLSALPGTTQPFYCESIESSMALPFGRGPGTMLEDMYSVGVVLATALTGKIPCQGMPDEEILYAKMAEGSFAVMTRGGRFSLTMMEGLRGLLNDDVLERWTLEDFGQWANGRRGSPIQTTGSIRASRAFSFAEHQFFTCREIGYAMSKNWDQAAAIIHDGSLDDWLRRALGDSNMVEAVGVAKMDLPPSEAENDDIVVTRVCIALDPDAPIRFRELSVMVDGFPSLISSLDDNRALLGLVSQVLNFNFLNFWIENQTTSRTDLMDLVRTLTQIRDILRRTAIGEGYERALYELNVSMPCLSTVFDKEYVIEAAQVLPALERVAGRKKDLNSFIDRHLAAFLLTRHSAIKGGEFRDLENEVDPYLPALTGVRVMATLQDSGSPVRAYHALCERATAIMSPALKRLHSRVLRKRVEAEVKQAVKSGVISEVLNIIDNPQTLADDQNNYQYAVMEYGQTVQKIHQLEVERQNRGLIAKNLGAQVSSVIAGFLMTLISIGIVIYYFLIKG